MTKRPPINPDQDEKALYLDDEGVRKKINPKIGRDAFKLKLRALEMQHDDFPRYDAFWRGRYWPAVKAWLDARNRIGNNADTAPSIAEDGPEDFDAAKGRKAGVQARQAGPAVLDGKPDPRKDTGGVSRSLHPIAGGRQ